VFHAFVDHVGAVDAVTLPFGLFGLAVVGLLALANLVAAPSASRLRRQVPSRILADV
jgi:hypothetical protein